MQCRLRSSSCPLSYRYSSRSRQLLYQHLLQRLPQKQRAEIDQAVQIVVAAIEQTSATLDGPAKKAAATAMATSLLAYLHISVPPQILSCLIEAAVYSLHQTTTANISQPSGTP